jgi:hypothetical protein
MTIGQATANDQAGQLGSRRVTASLGAGVCDQGGAEQVQYTPAMVGQPRSRGRRASPLRFEDSVSRVSEECIQVYLQDEFPQLVSYTRFVELMACVLVPLIAYFYHCKERCTGISLVDSTPLAVCHNRRIPRHKVFDELAARGKTSMGWFYSFKLHLVINDQLKNISQIEHTRHRSPINFLVNLFAGLIAYCHQPKKPSLNLTPQQVQALTVIPN